MAGSDVATGLTLTFGTSGFVADILSVDPVSATRDNINTSHLSTTVAHTFDPTDLIDWGELTFTMAFDADDEPPLDGAPETITITYPLKTLTSPATLVGTGFFVGFDITAALEEKMEATATIKWSGDLVWTDES